MVVVVAVGREVVEAAGDAVDCRMEGGSACWEGEDREEMNEPMRDWIASIFPLHSAISAMAAWAFMANRLSGPAVSMADGEMDSRDLKSLSIWLTTTSFSALKASRTVVAGIGP